jgi:hypothetical protein
VGCVESVVALLGGSRNVDVMDNVVQGVAEV